MYYKLTDQNLQTYKGYQWTIGEWKETYGGGELCSSGWLHCYIHPLLAICLNSIHADIKNPKLFEIEVGGKIQEDYGLKVGFTKMRLVKEIPLPQVTNTQKIAFTILCAKEVETDKKWLKWAENWLNNTDRTYESARIATATAVNATSYCAAVSAAHDFDVIDCSSAIKYAALSKPLNLIELAEKALTYN